jgi:hypothetical protein
VLVYRRNSAGSEQVDVMTKRVECLIDARIRDRKKMLAASQAIDRFRRKVPGWNRAQEIRRWRDHR